MAEQVGVMSRCLKSLDGLAYTQYGRNLKTWSNFEDFIEGIYSTYSAGIWDGFANGAGTTVSDVDPGAATRIGVITGSTGTTNTGRAGIFLGRQSLSPFRFSAAEYVFESDIYLSQLSTAIEEFSFYAGFTDSVTGESTDGVYFKYDRAILGPNWHCSTSDNSVRTHTDSGIAVTALAYNRFKIVVNNLANSASFYINGILVAVNIANIPGIARQLGASQGIYKSVGVTATYFRTDWIWIHIDLMATR